VNDRVILVTGASRGIGARLADHFAQDGATVLGVARTPIDDWEAEGVSDKIRRFCCDLTDESSVKRLFSEIRKSVGHVDVVVNNAGLFSGDLLVMATADRFQAVLRGNLLSAHLVTRESVKLMRAQQRGRVVSISSIASVVALPGNALYGTAKSALEGMMRDYAVEFRGSGITFNSVEISFVEGSGMVDALKPDARLAYESRLLVPRALEIREIAETINFFSSDAAATVTGQVIALGSPY
jgi:3-oxoacyl-[acyl-carrier protein] reductase